MANIQPRYDKNGNIISYSIRVFRGRDSKGKQLKPWTATFEVKPTWSDETKMKKAKDFASVFEKECKEGVRSDTRQRFSDYCDYVIELKEHGGAKHSTIVWYKEQTKRIYPEIGHIKLKDLTVRDLNDLYMKLSKTDIEATTAKAIIDLSSVLKEKHLTRKTLAEMTGLSSNTVGIAVSGNNCSIKTAKAISEALGLKFEKSFFVLNENKQLSGKTISGYHRLISTVLEQAFNESLIPTNIALKATKPKIEHKEITSLQTDDIDKILKSLESEPLKWRVMINLLIASGARRGEILGVTWSAVDFESNQIHICNNILYTPDDKKVYADKPKTKKSDRWISLPAEIMDLLDEWKTYQEEDVKTKQEFYSNKDGYLFTQENGSPMCPDSVTTYLTRFSEKYNLPHLHPHLFRHYQASYLIHKGSNIVSVSKRLGHSQVSTTTNIYAHEIEKADKENADLVGEIFTLKTKIS